MEEEKTEKITKKLLEMFEKVAPPPAAEDDSQQNKDDVPADVRSRPGPSASPEPNCAICLEPLQNKSFTDSCFHTFCFTCLVEWSKVKPECPLCKQKFKSIVHNVQKDLTFQEYHITATAVAAQRFRYRTTRTTWDQMVSHRMQYAPHSLVPANHSFRRRVYAEGLWVRPVPSPVSRIVTPDFLQRNPACEVRLARWLRREAAALLLPREQQRHLVEQTLVLLRAVPLRSTAFADAIRFNLGPRTAHFVHELSHFACSQHEDLEDYDRQAEYSSLPSTHPAQPLIIPSFSSSSSSDNDFLLRSSPDEEDCHVVGVVKPRAERTPELVVLSSDEEVEAVIDLSSDGSEDVQCVYEEPRPSTSGMKNYFAGGWVPPVGRGSSSSSPDNSAWRSSFPSAGPSSNPSVVKERKPLKKLASAVVLPEKSRSLYRFIDSEDSNDLNDSVRSWRSSAGGSSRGETPRLLLSLAANKSKIEKSWRSRSNGGSSRDSPIDSSANDHGKSVKSRFIADCSANEHGNSSTDLRIDSSANDHGKSGRSRSIADSSIDSSANDHGKSVKSHFIADPSLDLRIGSSANDYSKSGRSHSRSSRDSSRDSFPLPYDNGKSGTSHSIGDSSRELMIDSSANESGSKLFRSSAEGSSRRDISPSMNIRSVVVVSSSRDLATSSGGKSRRRSRSSRDLARDSSESWRSGGWKLQRDSSSNDSDGSSRKVKKLKLRSVGVVPGQDPSSSHRSSSHKKHKHKKKKRLHKHRRRIASDSDSN